LVTAISKTGSVLRQKGTGSTSWEDVDQIQEAFSRSPQNSTTQAALQLGIPQMTVWKAIHNNLYLHAYKV
jgi:hypothetical protein